MFVQAMVELNTSNGPYPRIEQQPRLQQVFISCVSISARAKVKLHAICRYGSSCVQECT